MKTPPRQVFHPFHARSRRCRVHSFDTTCQLWLNLVEDNGSCFSSHTSMPQDPSMLHSAISASSNSMIDVSFPFLVSGTSFYPSYSHSTSSAAYSSLLSSLSSVEATSLSSSLSLPTIQPSYISLLIILLVLLDIVLGSPMANILLSPLKSQLSNDATNTNAVSSNNSSSSLERIDSQAVAQRALDKAMAVTQLRDYLESQKSDYDRIQDIQKQICMNKISIFFWYSTSLLK
jgi:hypothetical protein